MKIVKNNLQSYDGLLNIDFLKMLAISILLLPSINAYSATFQIDFVLSGFEMSYINPAPTDPVVGSITYQADSIASPVTSLVAIDLTINGYSFILSELGFDFSPTQGRNFIGAVDPFNGPSTVLSGVNDFALFWPAPDATNTGMGFYYASEGISGSVWSVSNFAAQFLVDHEFSITPVPLPPAIVLFSFAVGLLGWFRK